MIQNLHTHTTCCDGKNTPEEMVHGAIRLGRSSHHRSWCGCADSESYHLLLFYLVVDDVTGSQLRHHIVH